jgi:hypothetical protein
MSRKVIIAALVSTLVAAAVIAAMVVLFASPGTNADPAVNGPAVPPPVNGPTSPPPLPQRTMKGDTDVIHVWEPRSGDVVVSPLAILGEARGTWYFEASFPVKLLDGNGKVLAEHYAEAQGDWMTADYVAFKGSLEFEAPDTAEGTLVLKKDNPSGLPEHEDEIRIPVRFGKKTAPVPAPAKPCVRTGCSGQVCADGDRITTCEFRAEYACYRNAECGRQPDGACGWTPTPELLQCIASGK